MVAHVGGDGVHVDVTEPEHQARRLHAPAFVALLQLATGRGGNERIGGRVDRALCRVGAHPPDRRERRTAHRAPIVAHRVDHQRVQQQLHAGLAHQVEEQRLVDLRIERRDRRHVVGGIGDMARRSAERDQPLHDLLRDSAHDPIGPGVKGHPRSDHCGRGSPAQEAVPFDQEGAGRRQRGRAARVSASHHQHVIVGHTAAFAAPERVPRAGARGRSVARRRS